MALDREGFEELVNQLRSLWQSNEASINYGENPQQYVEDHFPEGTTPDDVASAVPEACEGLPQGYQDNCARYNASHGAEGTAATHTVVNEVSYTYNTIYQQNAFIYAEEGAQVTNIQGDGNSVIQQDIDAQFNAEHPDSYDEYEEPHDGVDDEAHDDVETEEPYDGVDDEHEDGYDDDGETPPEEGYEGETPEDGYEEPPVEEPPTEEAPPEDTPEDTPDTPDDGAEAL